MEIAVWGYIVHTVGADLKNACLGALADSNATSYILLKQGTTHFNTTYDTFDDKFSPERESFT